MQGDKPWLSLVTSRPMPVAWMSPEDLVSYRGSTAGDIWAFGVLSWEVASLGKQPSVFVCLWLVSIVIVDLEARA